MIERQYTTDVCSVSLNLKKYIFFVLPLESYHRHICDVLFCAVPSTSGTLFRLAELAECRFCAPPKVWHMPRLLG